MRITTIAIAVGAVLVLVGSWINYAQAGRLAKAESEAEWLRGLVASRAAAGTAPEAGSWRVVRASPAAEVEPGRWVVLVEIDAREIDHETE